MICIIDVSRWSLYKKIQKKYLFTWKCPNLWSCSELLIISAGGNSTFLSLDTPGTAGGPGTELEWKSGHQKKIPSTQGNETSGWECRCVYWLCSARSMIVWADRRSRRSEGHLRQPKAHFVSHSPETMIPSITFLSTEERQTRSTATDCKHNMKHMNVPFPLAALMDTQRLTAHASCPEEQGLRHFD